MCVDYYCRILANCLQYSIQYRSFASCFGNRYSSVQYYCKRCATANQTREKEERTSTTFNAWDADVLARMDDFVLRKPLYVGP